MAGVVVATLTVAMVTMESETSQTTPRNVSSPIGSRLANGSP